MRGNLRSFGALAAAAMVVSCGGGGKSAPTPAPTPASTLPPQPSPTPAPAPLATCATRAQGTEQWPAWNPGNANATRIAQAVQSYHAGVHDWKFYHLPGGYKANGEYVTFFSFKPPLGSDTRFDDLGVPQGKYGDQWVYNPVTIAQYTLYLHTLHKRGEPLPSGYWAAIGKLQAMVGPDGALRYDFPFDGQPPGWVSAMAQGQALSAFSRAYLISGDESLIKSGNAVLEFMLKPVEEGGTRGNYGDLHPSLASYVSLYEYDHKVSPHTLNGFLFTIFGLYDWHALDGQAPNKGVKGALAKAYFDCGVHSVASTLGYYDLGGFSSYDMLEPLGKGETGLSPIYHKIHIALLVSLHSVTGRQELLDWAKVWANTVGQPVP